MAQRHKNVNKKTLTCSKQDNREGLTPVFVFGFCFRITGQRLYTVMPPFLQRALKTGVLMSNFIKCGLYFSPLCKGRLWPSGRRNCSAPSHQTVALLPHSTESINPPGLEKDETWGFVIHCQTYNKKR